MFIFATLIGLLKLIVQRNFTMLKIGQRIPDFTCESVVNNQITQLSSHDYQGQNKLLFFYPLDFTFVCPTELHALQDSIQEFRARNTQVLAISVDSVYSHLSWLSTPKSIGGIHGISYPLLSDITKTISTNFGVLNEEKGIALRGVFLIDKNNILQYAAINNLGLGRSISELVRLVDALAHVEQYGEVCPANWNAGEKAMKATGDGLKEYFGQV